MKLKTELIQKYNRPGPRYTSYPPVPFWNNTPTKEEWITHLKSCYREEEGVDIYAHVPYCESLCYYCGCNRTITKNHEVEDFYLAGILKEWEIYQEKLGFSPRINSLHFGGGTPTFLSPANLEKLIRAILKNKSGSFLGSIEIDPRTCNDQHLEVLLRNNIKRVSLGIQDFDPIVQKAINRDQSQDLVEELVFKLRKKGFSSVNFDLIYGLPKQSLDSVSKTIEIVTKMNPDLIAFYSYAHLPDRIKNQRLIKTEDLPSPEVKRSLYDLGKKLLMENAYVDVGMDHFAKPSSFLYQAMVDKKLHRNFMGYVDKKSNILIGLGPTSISDSGRSFIQNIKDVKAYEEKVMTGELPFEIGHTHNTNDLLIQEIILAMMCHNEIVIKNKENIPYWEEISRELNNFSDDGIIKREADKIIITEEGKGFVRNIAMSFDYYLREQTTKVKFSQTI